ncbi:hypothetical protein Aspvir_003192 [Aspergillus viridinutans]|uniref:Aminotransferase class I/classII large domain-containing protein n=1 Tax=Aspergillus viridinutans TaxID=75553 RepID=A0A9P3FB12_ASPVI|nr:uncharacterized protein Aspvir_003192 [Aspergillus viridinutans]GIK07526.1 hypothetical protein Aspvir_003192 [Aspergillus viridinutans]
MISEILAHPLGLAVVGPFLGFFLGVLEAAYPGILPQPLLNVLSAPINVYLSWCYPIKSADGIKDLPSCAYRWPNGQGDTAKFLQGIENSPRWEKAFGSIYRIWSGTKPEVVLTRPEHLQPVFFDSDRHTKAVNNNSGYLLGELLGKCVGLISPPQWQWVRAVTQPPFLHPACVAQTDRIQEIVRAFFQELELDDTGSLARGLIHPAHDLKMLPFWVVCELFYGPLPWHLVQELKRLAPLRENLMKHAIRGGLARFSWSRYLPTQANRELKDFQSRWRQFNRDVVAQARKAEKPAPIAKMYDAVDRREISEDQLLQTLDEALFANLDVTTGGLSWNLVFVAAHPDCQRKLREEMNEATGTGSLNKYLQGHSTYLQACILESSRLKPLAAFSVPQSAPTERVVGGFRIPAKTNFVVDAYALNIRGPYWAPDNETYRPERFLDRKNVELRYSFWRFGFGPRQCMGKYAADAVIRATLVYLLQQYNLSLREEGDWTRDQESWITHPDFYLCCNNGISVRSHAVVEAIMPKIQDAVAERTRADNPNIDLSTAENWLIRDELIDICKSSIQADLTTNHLSYPNGFSGDPSMVDGLASFLNEHFDPHEPVQTAHIATAPGAASCLDALLYTICDPGDAVLVPAPYWNGFDFQFRVRASVTPLPVNCSSFARTFSLDLLVALEEAIENATSPVKALVLTNPHNPFAQCYPREVIEACLQFCERHDLHLISDEVYALSIFDSADSKGLPPFVSALSLNPVALDCAPHRVHVIWSISKDFGSSGIRLGCTVSQHNPKVIVGVSLASNTQTSSLAAIFTQNLLCSPLTPQLMRLNRERLSLAYSTLTGWMKENGFAYIPANAGIFVFARLGNAVTSWDEEKELVLRCKAAGVLVSAGQAYHGIESEKGWVRITFAVKPEVLLEGLNRLALALGVRPPSAQ